MGDNERTQQTALGALLQGARQANGLTVRALADRMGFSEGSHPMLVRVENGTQVPSDRVLLGYAEQCGLDIDELQALRGPKRRSKQRPIKQVLDCAVQQEVILSIAADGVPERQDVRWRVTALKDGLEGQWLMRVARDTLDDRNFRDIRGGELEFSPYNEKPAYVSLYLRFFEPLRRGESHELAITFNPERGNRMFLVSPADRMEHQLLLLQIWLPAQHRKDVSLYIVNGYPMPEPLPPPLDSPSCQRMYPSSNGLLSWSVTDLAYRKMYGMLWKGSTPGFRPEL